MPVHPDPATSSPTIASFCASYHRIVSAAEALRGCHAEIAKQCIHWVDGSTHRPFHPRTACTRPGALPAAAADAFDDAASTPLSHYSQCKLAAVVNDAA